MNLILKNMKKSLEEISKQYQSDKGSIYHNNLENYKKYTNIFKTNFLFEQLFPPYVNSNTKP
jgi:hypothetical protein